MRRAGSLVFTTIRLGQILTATGTPRRPSTSLAQDLSVKRTMAGPRRSARIGGGAGTHALPNGEATVSGTSRSATPSAASARQPARGKRKQRTAQEDGSTEPRTGAMTTTKKKKKKEKKVGKENEADHDSRPPTTPLPSSAKLMFLPPEDASEGPEAKRRRSTRAGFVNRLADPSLTNATLLSPESARVVASRDVESGAPPSSSAASSPPPQSHPLKSQPPLSTTTKTKTKTTTTTTTETLLREACEHLIRVDARMKPLIDKVHCHIFSPAGLLAVVDPFDSLASSIISQQVSGAAAKSIKAKFVALFDEEDRDIGDVNGNGGGDGAPRTRSFPPPSKVAACSVERLRLAGLSQRKAEYIRGLAEMFAAGQLGARMLHDAPYEELLERLVAVRGLGRWSVEMFAVFGLKRMDVFSLGDLGVQRGCAAFVGRDVAKLKAKGGKWKYMSEREMLELSAPFAPYRSLFMWYMWQVEATDISVME